MRKRPLPRVQPTYPVELDRDNPLSRGMLGLWHFDNPARVVNLADPGHYDATPKNSDAVIITRDQYRGGCVDADGSAANWNLGDLRSSDLLRGAHTDYLTWFFFLYFEEGVHGNAFPRMVDVSTFGAGGNGYAVYASESANTVKFSVDGNGTDCMTYQQNAWQTWAVEFDDVLKRGYGWLNGVYDTYGTTANNFDLASQFVEGGFFNWMHSTDRQMSLPVPIIACWNRRLDKGEHLRLANDPFGMLIPVQDAPDELGVFLFTTGGGDVSLAGSSIMDMVAAGAMTRKVAMAGDSALASASTGALSNTISLTGSDSIVSTGSGALSRDVTISGSSSASISASASLVRSVALSGSAPVATIGSGALSADISLSGEAAIDFAGTGQLTLTTIVRVDLAGSAALGLTSSGDLSNTVTLTGTAIISLDVGESSELAVGKRLSGTASVTLEGNGELEKAIGLSGGANIVFDSSGTPFQIPVTILVIKARTDDGVVLKMRTDDGMTITARVR